MKHYSVLPILIILVSLIHVGCNAILTDPVTAPKGTYATVRNFENINDFTDVTIRPVKLNPGIELDSNRVETLYQTTFNSIRETGLFNTVNDLNAHPRVRKEGNNELTVIPRVVSSEVSDDESLVIVEYVFIDAHSQIVAEANVTGHSGQAGPGAAIQSVGLGLKSYLFEAAQKKTY